VEADISDVMLPARVGASTDLDGGRVDTIEIARVGRLETRGDRRGETARRGDGEVARLRPRARCDVARGVQTVLREIERGELSMERGKAPSIDPGDENVLIDGGAQRSVANRSITRASPRSCLAVMSPSGKRTYTATCPLCF
jgi:hypothetical protein